VYTACSDYVVFVALRQLVALEFSVRRPRGGRSVFLLFDDSSTCTRCLYLSPSQLCLIKRMITSYARARTHTRPHAYACVRTLAARSSRQSILGEDCPSGADFVQ